MNWPDAGATGAVKSPAQISALPQGGPVTSWLGFALGGRHSCPTCSYILPTLFKTGTVVAVLPFSRLFYFCLVGIGYCRAAPARAETCLKVALGLPTPGHAPSLACSSCHTQEAQRTKKKGSTSQLYHSAWSVYEQRTFNNRIPLLVFIAPIAQNCFKLYFLNPNLCHNLPENWNRRQVLAAPLCRPGDWEVNEERLFQGRTTNKGSWEVESPYERCTRLMRLWFLTPSSIH